MGRKVTTTWIHIRVAEMDVKVKLKRNCIILSMTGETSYVSLQVVNCRE